MKPRSRIAVIKGNHLVHTQKLERRIKELKEQLEHKEDSIKALAITTDEYREDLAYANKRADRLQKELNEVNEQMRRILQEG